jgi:hypothetical protein
MFATALAFIALDIAYWLAPPWTQPAIYAIQLAITLVVVLVWVTKKLEQR